MSQYNLFQNLHVGGAIIYGLTAIGCWLAIATARSLEDNHRRVERFLALGPVLGLSLGALILGGLGLHYHIAGGFNWSFATPETQRTATTHLLFLVFWISHFHLEIWTIEPLRKLQREEDQPHLGNWKTATRPVFRQLSANVLLFAALAALSL
ncbi:MAG: hypothetical protein VXW32_11515 [Myxococcota bacterium]|nr:hypothetical protein [Myxococcota bacterium]